MTRPPRDIQTELLVLRAQGGDREAVRELFGLWNIRLSSHASRLLGAHASMDAPDAVQEAWVAIVRRIDRLSDPALFAPWAHRIVAHKCADASRRAARQKRARLSTRNERGDERDTDDESRLREAVRGLEPAHREVISLQYGSGLGVSQIALAVGVPEGTVKSRLHAARKSLRAILDS